MNNDEFVYYFHGTNIEDPNVIIDFFNNGLSSNRGNHMTSTMSPVSQSEIQNNGLGDCLKRYCGNGYNTIFVMKIPKYYLTPKIENGVARQIPLPVWKPTGEKDGYGRDISQFTQELIYGVYRQANDSFLENSNYLAVHNPNGLQYDVNQIEHLLTQECMHWYNYANFRNDKSYQSLLATDLKNGTWDNAVEQYGEHFGNNQNGMKIA